MVYDDDFGRAVFQRPDDQDVKLTALVSSQQLRELKREAEADGITITESLRRALAIGLYVWRAMRTGDKLFLHASDGTVRELDIKLLGRRR